MTVMYNVPSGKRKQVLVTKTSANHHGHIFLPALHSLTRCLARAFTMGTRHSENCQAPLSTCVQDTQTNSPPLASSNLSFTCTSTAAASNCRPRPGQSGGRLSLRLQRQERVRMHHSPRGSQEQASFLPMLAAHSSLQASLVIRRRTRKRLPDQETTPTLPLQPEYTSSAPRLQLLPVAGEKCTSSTSSLQPES